MKFHSLPSVDINKLIMQRHAIGSCHCIPARPESPVNPVIPWLLWSLNPFAVLSLPDICAPWLPWTHPGDL